VPQIEQALDRLIWPQQQLASPSVTLTFHCLVIVGTWLLCLQAFPSPQWPNSLPKD
jgi:hypothetical protein